MSHGDARRAAQAPAGSGRRRRLTLAALVSVVAGPVAWIVQLGILTLVSDIPCRGAEGGEVLGVAVEAWWLIVSAGTAVVSVAGLWLAAWLRRETRRADEDGTGELDLIGRLATLGLWSSGLFLATILLGASGLLFLACP